MGIIDLDQAIENPEEFEIFLESPIAVSENSNYENKHILGSISKSGLVEFFDPRLFDSNPRIRNFKAHKANAKGICFSKESSSIFLTHTNN